ncbi:MMPL family transporter [Pseudomonas putida]|nr:MMPL family transporter [Pseudomonas putida]
MTNMGMEAIIRFLINWRRFNALWVVLVVLAVAPGVMNLRFDASIDTFLPEDNLERQQYEQFRQRFGDDRLLVIALPVQSLFTGEQMASLQALTTRLEQLPDVAKATSIASVDIMLGEQQALDILPAEKALANPAAYDRQRVVDKLLGSPLYLRDLISPDGQVTAILLEANLAATEGKFERILSGVHAIMNDSGHAKYYVAGEPVVEQQVTSDMWKDLQTFIPLTALILFVLLLVFLRNLGDVMVMLAVVTLCTLLLLGGMARAGLPMNAVTVGLPSIMMCVAVLDCLHLLGAYRQGLDQGMPVLDAVRFSLRQNLMPCFLTALTTAFGFLDLALSEVAPIRQFGVIASLAAIFAYLLSCLVMPFLLECAASRRVRRSEPKNHARWVQRFEPLYRSPRLLPYVSIALVVLAVLPIGRLHVEASFLNFIDKTAPIHVSTDYIERELGGVSNLEISLATEHAGGVLEPEALREIVALQGFISQIPGVDKSLSVVDFLKDIHREVEGGDSRQQALPPSRESAEQYVFTYSLAGPDHDLKRFIDYDNQFTRVRIRLQQMPHAQLQQVLDQVQGYLDSHPGVFEHHLTSYSVMQSVMVKLLLDGMAWSLLSAVLSMLVAFFILTRSWAAAVVAVIVNILPLVAVFGVMGALGLSINVGTSMIGCIMFGLVVDATLHCFYHARQAPAQLTARQVVRLVFDDVGEALWVGGLVLCAGFLVLGVGESYFTRLFGLFCALAVLVSLLCNALGIPYVIHHFLRRPAPGGVESAAVALPSIDPR